MQALQKQLSTYSPHVLKLIQHSLTVPSLVTHPRSLKVRQAQSVRARAARVCVRVCACVYMCVRVRVCACVYMCVRVSGHPRIA